MLENAVIFMQKCLPGRYLVYISWSEICVGTLIFISGGINENVVGDVDLAYDHKYTEGMIALRA